MNPFQSRMLSALGTFTFRGQKLRIGSYSLIAGLSGFCRVYATLHCGEIHLFQEFTSKYSVEANLRQLELTLAAKDALLDNPQPTR